MPLGDLEDEAMAKVLIVAQDQVLIENLRRELPPERSFKAAVAASKAQAAIVSRSGIGEHTYSTCICAIFLCELDPIAYRPEIEALMRANRALIREFTN